MSLQTFAQENVHFTKHDDYLVLKIPNLSKRRPSLIPNDGVVATCSPGNLFFSFREHNWGFND